jgi:hypothetical protein
MGARRSGRSVVRGTGVLDRRRRFFGDDPYHGAAVRAIRLGSVHVRISNAYTRCACPFVKSRIAESAGAKVLGEGDRMWTANTLRVDCNVGVPAPPERSSDGALDRMRPSTGVTIGTRSLARSGPSAGRPGRGL